MIPSLTIHWKLHCRSWMQRRKNKPITSPRLEHFDWLILPITIISDRGISQSVLNTASDSVSLIFTRSYRSLFLVKTPSPTPSPVKTSLSESESVRDIQLFRKKLIVGAFTITAARQIIDLQCTPWRGMIVLRAEKPERLIKLLEKEKQLREML